MKICYILKMIYWVLIATTNVNCKNHEHDQLYLETNKYHKTQQIQIKQ